jgi:hypothetical protein
VAKPKIRNGELTFRLGVVTYFTVSGKKFVAPLTADLRSDDGVTWTAITAVPVGTTKARITATLATLPARFRDLPGLADLTITITNGDGSADPSSNTQSQVVYVDSAP